jgi:hypothetical protein
VFEESGVAVGAGDAGGVEWLFGGFDCGKRRKMGEMGEGRDGRDGRRKRWDESGNERRTEYESRTGPFRQ